MATKTLIAEIDRLLRPLGFIKKKAVWNRKVGSLTDVIDIQDSKGRDSLTINAGVFRRDFFKFCWDIPIPTFVREPMCTVRSRIGNLFGSKDVWWDQNDPNMIPDILEKLSTYVLPFLEQMHSSKAMEEFLDKTNVIKQRYPPPIIYLALLKNENGNRVGACNILSQLFEKTNTTWKPTVAQVRESLACQNEE
jgi:hypothetical protein